MESDELCRTRAAIGWRLYHAAQVYRRTFKRLIVEIQVVHLIKEFNFNLIPSQISVKADVYRQFGALRLCNVGGGPYKILETTTNIFTPLTGIISCREPGLFDYR